MKPTIILTTGQIMIARIPKAMSVVISSILKNGDEVRDQILDLLLNRSNPVLIHVVVTIVDADAVNGGDNGGDFRAEIGLTHSLDHNRD